MVIEVLLSLVIGVPVRCQAVPVRGAAGAYDTVAKVVYLAPTQCRRLSKIAQGYEPRAFENRAQLAESLYLLGHEGAHAHGVVSEDEATHAGLRAIESNARAIGARPSFARALAAVLG